MRAALPMRLAKVNVVLRHELQLIRNDAGPLLVTMVMPAVVAAFVAPLYDNVANVAEAGLQGSDAAVPRMVVMFGFFFSGIVGVAFFHEYRWNTWERLRAEAITSLEIVVGKAVPYVLIITTFQVAVLASGWLLMGMSLPTNNLGLVIAITLANAVTLTAFAFCLVAVCSSVRQMTAYANLASLVFAGLGGAITPIQLLPEWIGIIARASPAYWAVRGFDAIIADSAETVTNTLTSVAALLAFAAVFLAIGLARFDASDRKTYAS